MRHTYDWSKLDAGWSADFTRHQLRYDEGDESHAWVSFRELARWEERKFPGDPPSTFVKAALVQFAKCRIDTNSQLVNEYLRNRERVQEQQRKHEATHGWRNPPSIYE